MNQAAIGQYIAGKRTAQGMTQEQLAQKIGVSQKSLMRWETGKRLPDADAVEALCTALGITLPELLYGKDSPQKEEMQLTHDAQMLDLLRRMQRTVYEQHILYGVLLILRGVISNLRNHCALKSGRVTAFFVLGNRRNMPFFLDPFGIPMYNKQWCISALSRKG